MDKMNHIAMPLIYYLLEAQPKILLMDSPLSLALLIR